MQTYLPYADSAIVREWCSQGCADTCGGHLSALLRKDPAHHRLRLGDEPDDLEHVWPVRKSA